MNVNQLRSKWAAVGAAIAVSLGAGGIGITHATTSTGEKPVYLPIEPCRMADTRPEFLKGPRATPLGADETYTLAGWGSNGDCNLPNGTAGLALNVTALDATAPTFLTIFPADATEIPTASNLNPVPGQPPTPNAVNVDLDDAGMFSIYNLAGNVHIIVDVVGIYDDHNHDDRYYQKSEVDTAVDGKADVGDSYTKAQSDSKYLSQSQDSQAAIFGADSSVGVPSSADVVVGSVTVDTPTSGYAVINAAAYIFNDGGVATRVRCSITSGTSIDSSALQIIDLPIGNFDEVAATRGFEIDKALIGSPATSTYNYVCDAVVGQYDTKDLHLTAIFIPDPDAFGSIIFSPADKAAPVIEGE
jgi:hypothetical protein